MITNREDLTHFWPLTENFIYAPEVGLALRYLRADWWKSWISEEKRKRYQLSNALGLAFLKHLEANVDGLEKTTSLAVQNSGGRVRLALEYRGQPVKKKEDLLRPSSDTPLKEIQSLISLAHTPLYLKAIQNCWQREDNFLLSKQTELSRETIRENIHSLETSLKSTKEALSSSYASYTIPFHSGLVEKEKGRDGGLLNILSIAALHSLGKRSINRVAIINLSEKHHIGTQDIFYSDPRVFTLSVHHPLPSYTGTGGEEDVGLGRGEGRNQNIEWQEGKNCTRRLVSFNPDLIFLRIDETLASLFPRMVFLLDMKKPLVVEASNSGALQNWNHLIPQRSIS